MLCKGKQEIDQRVDNVLDRGISQESVSDIIVFSKSVEEYLVHLEEVFRRLCKADVKLNPKKFRFVKQKVEYLGNVVTPEGVSPNPDRVHVVQEFPTPPPHCTMSRHG